MQTQLKVLDVTYDVHAKAKLLEATVELQKSINQEILAMPEGYKRGRYQKQMAYAEDVIKKQTAKLQEPVRESTETMVVRSEPQMQQIAARKSVTSEELLEIIAKKDLSSREIKCTAGELDEYMNRLRGVQGVQE